MLAGAALRRLESGLDNNAYASVARLPKADAGGEAGRRGSAFEWTVLISAPAYGQMHRGTSLADVVEQALSAYRRAHVEVHGIDDLEFIEPRAQIGNNRPPPPRRL